MPDVLEPLWATSGEEVTRMWRLMADGTHAERITPEFYAK